MIGMEQIQEKLTGKIEILLRESNKNIPFFSKNFFVIIKRHNSYDC